MKKLLIVLPLVLITTFASASEGANFPWQGAQIQTAVGGSVPIHGEAIRIRASGALFAVPETKFIVFFAYGGPIFSPVDWFWIAPQVGYAANWLPTDAGIASVWMGFAFFEGQLTIFTENEAIFNHKKADYYGYHAVDYNPLDWVNIGIQAEAVNKLVMFGPHVGFSKGPFHFELQWYAGVQEENMGHTVRIFSSLMF